MELEDGRGRRIGFRSSEDWTRARRAKAALLSGRDFIVLELLVELGMSLGAGG